MVLLQEITVPGCVECKRFKEWWGKNSSLFSDVNFEEVSITDPKGQELVLKFQIMSSPGILINNELFSTGGVNTAKLTAKLKELGG